MADNEKQAARVVIRPAWRAFFMHFVAVVVFAAGPWISPGALLTPLAGQLMAAGLLVFVLLKRFASYYVLTENSILIKNLGSATIEVKLQDISRVLMRQGFIRQKLGYGSLMLQQRYRSDNSLIMFGILLPDKVRQYILNGA